MEGTCTEIRAASEQKRQRLSDAAVREVLQKKEVFDGKIGPCNHPAETSPARPDKKKALRLQISINLSSKGKPHEATISSPFSATA